MGCDIGKEKLVTTEARKELFSGEHYKLTGEVDDEKFAPAFEGSKAVWQNMKEEYISNSEFVINKFRPMLGPMMTKNFGQPEYVKFDLLTDTEKLDSIGGTEFHPDAVAQNGFIHRVKGKSKNRPCMVYFHGGGAIVGDADQNLPIMNRYAVEADVTIINVNYRLAPEHPAPKGIYDAYAALKDILKNHRKYGINPKRVGVFGESGGGYITAGIGILLAEKNESKLVRFQLQQIAMTSDFWLNKNLELNDTEKSSLGFMLGVIKHLQADGADKILVFPNLISDQIAKKVPPVIIQSCDNDFFRRASEEAAKLYERNGKLLAFGILRGGYHGSYYNYGLKSTDEWFAAFGRACQQYLI